MLTYHELVGFMPPALADEILGFAYETDKTMYKAVLAAVADARKLRPAFFEKKPRAERHKDMLSYLSRPRLENAAAELIRAWLIKAETPMLSDFLDALEIKHEKGVAQSFPDNLDDAKVTAGVDLLLSKYPREKVIVYLNAFHTMNDTPSAKLGALLQEDARLQII